MPGGSDAPAPQEAPQGKANVHDDIGKRAGLASSGEGVPTAGAGCNVSLREVGTAKGRKLQRQCQKTKVKEAAPRSPADPLIIFKVKDWLTDPDYAVKVCLVMVNEWMHLEKKALKLP